MKQKIYNSSSGYFPVNQLKSSKNNPQMMITPTMEISTSKSEKLMDKIPFNVMAQSGSFSNLEPLAVAQKLLPGAKQLLTKALLAFLAVQKWLQPYYIKVKKVKWQFDVILDSFFDSFFNFMERFLFMDEMLLQAAPIVDDGNVHRQNIWTTKLKNIRKIVRPSRNFTFSAGSNGAEINSDSFAVAFEPIFKSALKILPKIKLPLKTNNPDGRLSRPVAFYPVYVLIRRIFSTCIRIVFLRKPKHLNPGLWYRCKPAL